MDIISFELYFESNLNVLEHPLSLMTVYFGYDLDIEPGPDLPDFSPYFISVISSKVNVLNDWRADAFPKKKTTWSTTGQNGMYRGSQKWNELK